MRVLRVAALVVAANAFVDTRARIQATRFVLQHRVDLHAIDET